MASARRAGHGEQTLTAFELDFRRLGCPDLMDPLPHTGDVCLATAVTDSYVPGAVVMLDSFRTHHPGFDGDVVILHGGLSEASRTVLAAVGGRVRFEPVRPDLTDRVARLREAYPHWVRPSAVFHAIHAFRLDGYRKVLFYDSDMLFQEPVGELFGAGGEALLCCGDQSSLADGVRDAETLRPLERGAADADRPVLEHTFNSGFLLIDASCIGERVYADLLARMAPEEWRGFAARPGLDDQVVLNRYFAGRQTLASWTYNYLVPDAAAIRARTGLDAARAKVLHFKGAVKPWAPDAMLQWARGETGKLKYRPAVAPFKRWYDAYVDVLARTHLRMAWPELGSRSMTSYPK